jgi:hypothetical protein
MTLVEAGIMQADEPEVRERMAQFKLRRSDLDRDIETAQRNLPAGASTVTPESCMSWLYGCASASRRLTGASPSLNEAAAELSRVGRDRPR